MNKSFNHPYHMVTLSPWPLISSINLMTMLLSANIFFHENNFNYLIYSIILMVISISQWWRDIIRESTFQGFHNDLIKNLLSLGMILFIISEIFFFLSFFWTYFHMSLSPSIEIGCLWPPMSIIPFNPYNIPLLNTIILLSSGLSITWSHYSILNNKKFESLISLTLTILLGIYFSYLQYIEYNESSFSMSDSIYGSTFYLITGFHGIHVIIGTMFIMITMLRLMNNHFSSNHHFGFEASSWYWHFVDIIWLFVYITIYWWTF